MLVVVNISKENTMDPITATMWFLWGALTGWVGTEVLHGVFDKDERPAICQYKEVQKAPDKNIKCFRVYEKEE